MDPCQGTEGERREEKGGQTEGRASGDVDGRAGFPEVLHDALDALLRRAKRALDEKVVAVGLRGAGPRVNRSEIDGVAFKGLETVLERTDAVGDAERDARGLVLDGRDGQAGGGRGRGHAGR